MAGDVRLTMGGEPTFVAVDNRDAPEWNIDAMGPTKRGLATALVHKLRDEYGAGGFLHFGQGKWYPGEQLPRWALNIYWRADGQPVWANPALFADERVPTHYTSADAQRFTRALAAQLGLSDAYMLSAYEDVWYYLWRERRLPVNVDPFDSKLGDEMERMRLRRVFEQKLDSEIGYVLPIKAIEGADRAGPHWRTGPWFVRDERLYLMPGDSPMGLRLPLDSLPWVSEADFPYLNEADPSVPKAALPARDALATAPGARSGIRAGYHPAKRSHPAERRYGRHGCCHCDGYRWQLGWVHPDQPPRPGRQRIRPLAGPHCACASRCETRAEPAAPRPRRWGSSRACSMCLCHRWNSWKTTCACSPPWRPPPSSWACRSCWRATRRRATRA